MGVQIVTVVRKNEQYVKDEQEDYNCKEDDLVDNFLKLLLSEFILRYLFYIYWTIFHNLKSSVVDTYNA